MWHGACCGRAVVTRVAQNGWSVLIGWAALSLSVEARAAPALGWSAPPECGEASTFAAALERELGDRELPGPVRVEVRPQGSAYALHLELLASGDGARVVFERRLIAPTCFELRSAALSVLVVSAADVSRESETPQPVSVPASAEPPPPQPPSPEVPSAEPRPHPQTSQPPGERHAPQDPDSFWRLAWDPGQVHVGLGAGLESGRVGEVAPRIQGDLRLPWLNTSVGKLGLATAALYVPPKRHEVDAERGGELSRAALRLGGALAVERGLEPLTLQLAFQAELARVSGTGYGVSSPTTRGVWRTALIADGEVGVALERVKLAIWGELSVARDDSRYVLDGVGEVYRPSILAVGGGLRAWLRFP